MNKIYIDRKINLCLIHFKTQILNQQMSQLNKLNKKIKNNTK